MANSIATRTGTSTSATSRWIYGLPASGLVLGFASAAALWHGLRTDQALFVGAAVAGFLIAVGLAVIPSAQYLVACRRVARRRAATLADLDAATKRN